MEKVFIIAFDIPSNELSFKKKIHQLLKKSGSKMIQRSLWECKDLNSLIKIATLIKYVGGKAYVFEAMPLFS
jgi:CRISPR-associated endonuclease Cas2